MTVQVGDDVYVSTPGVHAIINIVMARVLAKDVEPVYNEEGELENKEILTVLPHGKKFALRVFSSDIGV